MEETPAQPASPELEIARNRTRRYDTGQKMQWQNVWRTVWAELWDKRVG